MVLLYFLVETLSPSATSCLSKSKREACHFAFSSLLFLVCFLLYLLYFTSLSHPPSSPLDPCLNLSFRPRSLSFNSVLPRTSVAQCEGPKMRVPIQPTHNFPSFQLRKFGFSARIFEPKVPLRPSWSKHDNGVPSKFCLWKKYKNSYIDFCQLPYFLSKKSVVILEQ